MLLSSLLNLPAEDWTALAAWSTVAVAVAAAVAALRQVSEARRLRLEQAQPYVVTYLEESGVSDFVDLVVKNLGTTAALEVSIEVRPEPRRAMESEHSNLAPLIPDDIPVLVPGQEWRTLFDPTFKRAKSDLPMRYEAAVRFKDSRGQTSFELDYVLDWNLMINRATAVVYGVHDAAKALREINKTLGRRR